MPSTVTLYNTSSDEIIWEFINLDDNIAKGITDAIYYALANDPNMTTHAVKWVVDGVLAFDGSYKARVRLYNKVGRSREEIDDKLTAMGANDITRNLFIMVLNPLDDSKYFITTADNAELYLQGVLTIAKHYNISIDRILARKPYKNGKYYDIK